MEMGPFLMVQPGREESLVDLEWVWPSVGLTQDLGDEAPDGLDVENLPRQDPPQAHSGPAVLKRNDSKEIVTYISESMTVTSADEEKLLLLNKNTELRKINKELMKLNRDWDYIYHATNLGLKHQLGSLQEEVAILKMQAQKLSAKLEHERSKREYYEQSLFQELKHSQALQEYVRQLEGQKHHNQKMQLTPESDALAPLPWEEFTAPQQPMLSRRSLKEKTTTQKEVTDLKVQLEALKCQTEIYKADYRTEQKDRQRVKAENAKLRQKEEEMRQQMALLEEQLKIFEDDFRRERSDKQVLQRLLKRKPDASGPTLAHRCNNHKKPSAPSPVPQRLTCCGCRCKPQELHRENQHRPGTPEAKTSACRFCKG